MKVNIFPGVNLLVHIVWLYGSFNVSGIFQSNKVGVKSRKISKKLHCWENWKTFLPKNAKISLNVFSLQSFQYKRMLMILSLVWWIVTEIVWIVIVYQLYKKSAGKFFVFIACFMMGFFIVAAVGTNSTIKRMGDKNLGDDSNDAATDDPQNTHLTIQSQF